MANKSSGRVRGVRRGVEGIDNIRPGSIEIGTISPLDSIPDKVLRDQQRAVISRIFKRYGFEADTVALAPLGGAWGVNVQSIGNDGVNKVYLSKAAYKSAGKIREAKVSAYKQGWSVKTRNPLQHTLVHELAHSKWISEKDQNGIKKRIQPLWEQYQAEVESKIKKYGRKEYAKYLSIGQYAGTNINEFWAEASTQYLIGAKQTKYSKAVGKIWNDTFAKNAGKAKSTAGGRAKNPTQIPGVTTIPRPAPSKRRKAA